MNIEIEKKYYIDDYAKVKAEVEATGAKAISDTTDIDVYFAVPQEKPNTLYLRVRTKNGKSTLAYHEVVSDLETREWEVEVSDGRIAREIIEKLGFAEDVTVEKRREKFELNDTEILIDQIKGLGYFLEIEAPNESELDQVAKGLTLGKQVTGVGYPDLLKEKQQHEKSIK